MSGTEPSGDARVVARTDVSNDRVAALVATELLRAAPAEIDETITRAFAEVGHHRSVARAYYYRLDAAAGAFELAHEWHAPGVGAMRDVPGVTRLPLAILPDALLATLRRGGAVTMPRTRGVLASPVEQIVAIDGDRALVLVPALLGGVLLGVAGFAAACESAWAAADFELLEIAAQGVARAVERRRVDVAHAVGEGVK